ncbi:MAG TPA: nucleotidyltransferase family protein [Planctomycetota bacterium]|nr:nucleotidyltransferase family protein [Planctomycetota bacterium]
MKCLVLCAGYATRLYPLTKDRPKPLLPVGGIPLLQRIADRVSEIRGCDRLYVVTNHRFTPHFREWEGRYRSIGGGKVAPVEVIDDGTTNNEDRLGAIGDVDYAIRTARIDDDLLVLAGDNLLLFDLAELCRFGASKGIGIALKDLKNRELAKLYGVVEVDRESRVVAFEEKPSHPKSSLASIGAYYFCRANVPLVRRYLLEGNKADQPGNYVQWLYRRVPVYGFVIPGQWYDIGDLDSYRKANEMFGIREAPPATPSSPAP